MSGPLHYPSKCRVDCDESWISMLLKTSHVVIFQKWSAPISKLMPVCLRFKKILFVSNELAFEMQLLREVAISCR